MDIDWKEPPGKARGRKRSALTIYEDLKENPGKWALWRQRVYPNSGYGLRKSYPAVQVTLRRNGENERGTPLFDVYVRWVGELGEFADDTPLTPDPF